MEKTNITDIHIHLLSGVDDGAKDENRMYEMLDAAYADGTRVICATPHFHPGFWGDNKEASSKSFDKLKSYAEKYDDLQLYIGNEIRYSPNCLEWIENGMCRALNNTRYVLIDFLEDDKADYIVSSTLKVLNTGYVPILAHAERYEEFHGDFREIIQLKQCGVVIQIDAQSPLGGWGRGSKKRSRKIIGNHLADIVASDAHNVSSRPPQMSNCYNYVVKNCGEWYANEIFWKFPKMILEDKVFERV